MKYKRYQYFSNEGIKWTEWFLWDSDIVEKWQLKNKLRNDYK